MSTDEIVVLFSFLVILGLIFSERVPRTTAAVVGALFLTAYMQYSEGFSEEQALGYIKADVLLLLLGMMIVVGVLIDTGFFEFVALKIGHFSRGNLWLLMLAMATVVTFLSMVIDNVTAVILMTPIIIELSRKLEIDPIPLLIVGTLFSNIGGVATLVGDPPNLIIASHADFSFNDFLIHLAPLVLLIFVICLAIVWKIYAPWYTQKCENFEVVMKENPWDKITDHQTFKRTVAVLAIIIILFLVHDSLGVSPAFVAMVGGGLALLVNLSDPERVLHHVEWGTIIFFAALFIIVGVVNEVGLLEDLANWIVDVSHEDALIAAMLILWLSALGSAVVNRVPFTVAFAAIIEHMGGSEGIDTMPLFWALAMGVGFGSNLTPLGSSAGTVVIGIAERDGHHITMKEWLKSALPVTMVGLVLSSLALALFLDFYS